MRDLSHTSSADDERRPVADGGLFDLDEVLYALSSRQRRYVLYHLLENEIATVREVARGVESWDSGTEPRRIRPADVTRRATELVHGDLPHLADLSFVEYDGQSETLRYTDPPTLLEQLLEVCLEVESRAIGRE